MQDYKKLDIYNQSKRIALEIYKVTENFPKSELYGLTAQLRRAAVSIGANVVEGCGRHSKKDFLNFLHNSYASLGEIEYELELAYELGYVPKQDYESLEKEIDRLGGMIFSFMRAVRTQLKTENRILGTGY